jgi:hypothetical protein
MKRALGFVLTALLAVACQDNAVVAPGGADFTISDGASVAPGNPDFFFLPPMVPDPSEHENFDAAEFNATLSPVVQICEGTGSSGPNGTECAGTEIAEFTMTSGPGSMVRVSAVEQHYIVNWHTDQFVLDPALTYRIRVLVGDAVLGFADVELGATRGELKNVNTEQNIPLLDGRTLPIKFRVETGSGCFGLVVLCAEEVVDLSQGGEIVLANGDRVDIPSQNSGQVITVTLEICDGIDVDLPTFGTCLHVTTDEPLAQALSPRATVSICSAPPLGLSEGQDALLRMHREDNEGNITVLPYVPGFCAAPESEIGSASASLLGRLARAGWRAMRDAVASIVKPQLLFAGSAAVAIDVGGGGETDFFSDFQFALPAQMDPIPGTDGQSAPPNTAVENPPGVIVTDANGEPVENATVHFEVTLGGGTLTPVEVMSNADGVAQLTAWVLGAEGAQQARAFGKGIAGPGQEPFMPNPALPIEVQTAVPIATGQVFFNATVVEENLVLYGVESGTDGLSTINPSTGAVAFIDRLDPDVTIFTTPVAMSVRASDNTLFVWNNSNGNTNETQVTTGVLLTVDPCTGDGTPVNSTTPPQGVLSALAFSPAGTLYGLSGNELYQINPATGVKTLVGTSSLTTFIAVGADFRSDGALFALELSLGTERLVTINASTGAATVVATLNSGGSAVDVGIVGSIVFTPSGTLTGTAVASPLATPVGGDIIFDINPSTGAVSNVRNGSGGAQGLGYAPACSPSEP